MKLGPLFIDNPITLDSLADNVRLFIAQVFNGLRHLSFTENFEAFEMELAFSSTAEIPIPNPLRGPIPTKWVVTDIQGGAFTPCRGDTAWSSEYLYLKNPAGGTITAKVIFFR